MSFWIKLAVGLAAAYGAIGFAGFLGQRKLMYFPDRHRTLPADVGLADVQERTIETPDGARVVAWYGRARPGRPTLLYFHGNGGSLSIRAPRIARFMNEGWGVYMMTYRGYGGSTGSPSETIPVPPPISTLRSKRHLHPVNSPQWTHAETPLSVLEQALVRTAAARTGAICSQRAG